MAVPFFLGFFLALFFGLESGANRFVGAMRAIRSNRDLSCRAVASAVVVMAVLYVAMDSLDLATLLSAIVVLIVFHFDSLFSIFIRTFVLATIFPSSKPI